MTRRAKLRALVGIALMQSTALAAQETPFAIACTGELETHSSYSEDEDPKVEVSQKTWTYIIDEAAKDVALYNEATESPMSLCNTDHDRCSFEFYPAMILLNWTSEDYDDNHVLSLDRKKGTILDMSRGKFFRYTFNGACVRTAIPKPTPETYAF